MLRRTMLAVSSMAVVIMVAIGAASQPGHTEEAAKECLSKPGAAGPAGTWWYYRIDRANNNRRCWYLADKKARTSARAERNSESTSTAPQRARKSKARQDAVATAAARRAPASPTTENERAPARTGTRTARNETPSAPIETPAARDEMPSAPIERSTARDEMPSARVELPPAEHTGTGSVTNSRGNRYATGAMIAAATPTLPALSDAEPPASTPKTERVDPQVATVESDTSTSQGSPATTEPQTAAAYQQSEPTPGFGHLLLFIMTAAAFAAVALYAVLKLRSAWLDRRQGFKPVPTLDGANSQSHSRSEQSSDRLVTMMRTRTAQLSQQPEYSFAGDAAEGIPHDDAAQAPDRSSWTPGTVRARIRRVG
jgi:hypothetical protein